MSPTSPESPAGGRPSTRAPATEGARGSDALEATRLLWLALAVVVTYGMLWLVGRGPLEPVYTAEWAARRIVWFYAPVTLALAALSRRVLPTALSVLGYVLGVVVGEVIGGRVFAAQSARLDRELAGGGLQSWEPVHPGWWIASLVFIALTAAGAIVAWRSARSVAEERR